MDYYSPYGPWIGLASTTKNIPVIKKVYYLGKDPRVWRLGSHASLQDKKDVLFKHPHDHIDPIVPNITGEMKELKDDTV